MSLEEEVYLTLEGKIFKDVIVATTDPIEFVDNKQPKRYKRKDFDVPNKIIATVNRKVVSVKNDWEENFDTNLLKDCGIIINLNIGSIYCEYCQCFLPSMSVIKDVNIYNIKVHIVSLKHKPRLTPTSSDLSDPDRSAKIDEIFFELEEDALNSGLGFVVFETNRTLIEYNGDSKYYCKLCKQDLVQLSGTYIIFQHVLGETHLYKFKNVFKHKTAEYCMLVRLSELTSYLEQYDDLEDVNIIFDILENRMKISQCFKGDAFSVNRKFILIPDKKTLFCSLCKTVFPKSCNMGVYYNLLAHLRGRSHIKLFKTFYPNDNAEMTVLLKLRKKKVFELLTQSTSSASDSLSHKNGIINNISTGNESTYKVPASLTYNFDQLSLTSESKLTTEDKTDCSEPTLAKGTKTNKQEPNESVDEMNNDVRPKFVGKSGQKKFISLKDIDSVFDILEEEIICIRDGMVPSKFTDNRRLLLVCVDSYSCNLCKMCIPLSICNLMEHLFGRKHKSLFKKKFRLNTSEYALMSEIVNTLEYYGVLSSYSKRANDRLSLYNSRTLCKRVKGLTLKNFESQLSVSKSNSTFDLHVRLLKKFAFS